MMYLVLGHWKVFRKKDYFILKLPITSLAYKLNHNKISLHFINVLHCWNHFHIVEDVLTVLTYLLKNSGTPDFKLSISVINN